MVFTFIALWTITIILIINGSKKDSMIWGALITFFGGCGAFARAMIESFLPYLQKYELVLPSAEAWFYNIYSIGSFMNTNGLPYAFFMFTFCYS
ncbi:MAG TPA: histidine kinase, partial [Bacilli bacterium]